MLNEEFFQFELTDGERANPLWMRLKTHFEGMLMSLRASNDADQSEQKTAALRGEIKLLKRIIAFGDPRPDTTGN